MFDISIVQGHIPRGGNTPLQEERAVGRLWILLEDNEKMEAFAGTQRLASSVGAGERTGRRAKWRRLVQQHSLSHRYLKHRTWCGHIF